MQLSQNGLALIQCFEGLKLEPYLDSADIWTIGFGHALTTPNGEEIKISVFGTAQAKTLMQAAMLKLFGNANECTAEQAHDLLVTDLAPREAQLTNLLGAVATSQDQFDAMFDLLYNTGVGNFESSSVLRLHRAGETDVSNISLSKLYGNINGAITTMAQAFVAWSKAAGQVELGLFRRRVAEILVYGGWDATQAFTEVEGFNP